MKPPPEFADGELIPLQEARSWLRACGQSTKIYRGSRFVGASRIEIGSHSQIDEAVWIFAGQRVSIGSHVHLAIGSSILGGGTCVIQDFVGVGAGVRLVTGSEGVDGQGLTNPTVPESLRLVERSRVEIEEHAVVFTNCVVFPGVCIGAGAVIAAGSVVHRSVRAWGIYAGNPLVQVGVRPKETILRLAEQLRVAESLSTAQLRS